MAEDNNNFLFSQEELESMEAPHLFNQKHEGPVTVLEHTFENDDERRAFFREELRKRLPELKKIEGYPIGEDDDIIALSDPPYFTACPNPWLDDFVEEWEAEKKILVAEGKREAEKVVTEPYAYGITQGKNSAIYNAHTYHTKVPHQVIMRYILHYTQPGDIILDGFAGTGMAGVAASVCGNPDAESRNEIELDFKENGFKKPIWGKRNSICGDLSPLCFHISSNYNSQVDTVKLRRRVDSIVEKLKDRFGHFYCIDVPSGKNSFNYHINYFVWSEIVSCRNCGYEMNVHDLSFDYNTQTLHSELVCPNCGTVHSKNQAEHIKETVFDELSGESYSQLKYRCCLLNYSIPGRGRGFARDFPEPDFPKFEGYIPFHEFGTGYNIDQLVRTGCTKVFMIYPKRTQYVLAYLHKLINESDDSMKKPLMFIFTSMLPKLTRLNRYMPQHGSRALVGPMANVLYLPPQYVENNPIDQFEYQAAKVIRAFEYCEAGSAVQICSATHSSLPDESVGTFPRYK